jgi:hypothetical protein
MPYGDGSAMRCSRIPEERHSAGKGMTIVGRALRFMLRRSWLRKRGTDCAVQISATYGTLTPMRQACQGSEPNHPVGLLALRTPILLLHLCAEESRALESTSASWCCLDRLSPQVQCSARANPFVKICPQDDYRPGSRSICAAWNKWRDVPLDDILGRIQGGVDPSTPRTLIAVVRRRKLELERFPIASEDAVHEQAFRR